MLSPTFIFNTFDRVHANTTKSFFERGDVLNNPYAKSGMHDGIGFIENIKEASEMWSKIGENVLNILDYINNLPENIIILSTDLLSWCYKILATLILQTPTFIFNNSWFKESISTFTIISIAIFTLVTILTRIKGIFIKKNATTMKDIIKRYFIAVVGIGFSPFLFEKGFYLLNVISKSITALGYHELSSIDFVGQDDAGKYTVSIINVLALLGFDIVLIATLIPILLQNGRRWFDLLTLSVLTPFSLSAWVFNEHRHYFNKWWQKIKKIGMTQVIYAVFLAIMGIFMFGTRNVTDVWGILIKTMVLAGGLWRMSNIPTFMIRMVDAKNADTFDIFSNLKNIATLNILRGKPFNMIRKLIKK